MTFFEFTSIRLINRIIVVNENRCNILLANCVIISFYRFRVSLYRFRVFGASMTFQHLIILLNEDTLLVKYGFLRNRLIRTWLKLCQSIDVSIHFPSGLAFSTFWFYFQRIDILNFRLNHWCSKYTLVVVVCNNRVASASHLYCIFHVVYQVLQFLISLIVLGFYVA